MRSLVIVASLLLAAAASGQSKNILMYGNSFSMGHGGVHQGLARIATATGHATPNVVARFFGGQTLTFHATDPAQVAAITNSLGPNESWDVVVIQGHSIEATAT
ncbi:MAG: hypothetical protein KAI24_03490, partial [Planctomycetes bacterium]|nr:hypothetical protein [Planctomycetota bacterium]